MKHENAVCSATFSPDGRRVLTASRDNTARIWDAETGKPVGKPMKHAEVVATPGITLDYRVVSALFSPNGKRVVTAGVDKTARTWDVETGQPVGKPMTHGAMVVSASFSSDGRHVVITGV